MSEIVLEPMASEHRVPVIDIFNYYIENSFAAYLENSVPYELFGMFLKMTEGYPALVAKDEDGEVVGFGFLRSYNPMPAFSKTAEISYFIRPESRGGGIGTAMLNHLIDEARKKGITSILACISSKNEPSISFHAKNGFTEVGRFNEIGIKNGEIFDVVWMQRIL